MRRSLTITPENDKKILLTKGRFLTGESPFDIDYTTLVNIFIELGHKLMITAWNDSNNPNVVIDKKEIVEQSGLASNEQNPAPALTAEQSSISDTKKQKYIS